MERVCVVGLAVVRGQQRVRVYVGRRSVWRVCG